MDSLQAFVFFWKELSEVPLSHLRKVGKTAAQEN